MHLQGIHFKVTSFDYYMGQNKNLQSAHKFYAVGMCVYISYLGQSEHEGKKGGKKRKGGGEKRKGR